MQICDLVNELYFNTVAIKLTYSAQSILAGISLVLLTFLFFKLCLQRMIPNNARILMANLCATYLLANVGTLFSSLYYAHVFLLRSNDSACFWLRFTKLDCFVIRSIFNVGVFGVYISSICLALDRMINSFFIISSKRKKKIIALLLIALQWIISCFVLNFPHLSLNSGSTSSAHCVVFTPTPTQVRYYFFAILGIQALSLATYTILTYHNNFDKMICNELRKFNIPVIENILALEQTLPALSCNIGLFLASVFLDRNFIDVLKNLISPMTFDEKWRGEIVSEVEKRLIVDAQWNEYQTLSVPILSLIFFVVVILQIKSPQKTERVYEHISSNDSRGEEYYENQSDCLSFKTTPSVGNSPSSARINSRTRSGKRFCVKDSGEQAIRPTNGKENAHQTSERRQKKNPISYIENSINESQKSINQSNEQKSIVIPN